MNDHFECTTSHLENVSQLGLVSGISSHGIGFFTGMCDFFCRFFGESSSSTLRITPSMHSIHYRTNINFLCTSCGYMNNTRFYKS